MKRDVSYLPTKNNAIQDWFDMEGIQGLFWGGGSNVSECPSNTQPKTNFTMVKCCQWQIAAVSLSHCNYNMYKTEKVSKDKVITHGTKHIYIPNFINMM